MAVVAAASVAAGQQVGTMTAEQHPALSVQECSTSGGCQTVQKSVVVDSNWRWTHKVGQATNCYKGNTWDPSICPDAATCTENCALEGAGAEYENTYGITATGSALRLNFVTHGQYSTNIGSRVYLLDSESEYHMFQLKNKEFTFDVDVSQLPCGLNGALYFVQMDKDGGMERFPTNKAGAKYGTGYCDAQCPHDMKFINGQANSEGWKPSGTDKNSGAGKYGSCCTEFDVWEANSAGMAYTAHACNVTESYRCEGAACGDNGPDRFNGVCDKNGCDFQTHRLGDTTFYGTGSTFALDTTKPMTVVTQYLTDDNTTSGNLVEVRRFYVQNGKKFATPSLKVGTKGPFDSLKKDYCQAEVDTFQDGTNFFEKGGFEATGLALEKGMVLAMSLWDDHYANMLWLDGAEYPVNSTAPGSSRGPCSADSGKPADVEGNHPDAYVIYSNIKYGDLGSTQPGQGPAPTPPGPTPPQPGPTPPTPPSPSGAGQCCYGGCNSGNCQGGWCGQSQDHCTGNCNGDWCPQA